MTTLPEFQIPKIAGEESDDNKGTFTIEPLDKGFGYTFGNSLRRVLLSSLGGAAITSVRIEGVAHEFSTIPGLKEDVTDLVLNLKDIVVRMHTDADEVETPLVATGPGEVKAKDIDLPAGVEILNPEAPIATLEKKTKLEIYLTIGRGRGYSPADENKSDEKPIGVVPIDSIFSPIRRAAYSVDSARVGQRTDFDKLTLEVETDGSIEPGAALRDAAEILIKSLAIFTEADRVQELTGGGNGAGAALAAAAEGGSTAADVPASSEDSILIEELELGVRSYNCLKRAGIQTVGDLIRKSEGELSAIPNFGSKSIEEVVETLRERGLSLRPDPESARAE
jgi:DNA-directed RNA polymerase subunit alpha